MFAVSDIKICLSSFEFSLFYQHPVPKFCSSCGHFLEVEPNNEARLSSLLLLMGVGAFVCYKFLSQKRRRRKKSLPVQTVFVLNGENHCEQSLDDLGLNMSPAGAANNWIKRDLNWASTPFNPNHYFVDEPESLSEVSESEVASITNYDLVFSPEAATFASNSKLSRTFSTVSSVSVFGDGTVAKLDQLLNQIEDIKKSVVEIDADLFSVGKVTQKSNKRYLTLGADPENGEDSSDPLFGSNTEPHSPSVEMEWDSEDINAQTYFFNDGDNVGLKPAPESPMSPTLNSLTSPTKLSSCSSSVPSEVTSLSSSSSRSLISIQDQDKLKQIKDLMEEARKLGLLNDLLEALLKNNKRDSAYFED